MSVETVAAQVYACDGPGCEERTIGLSEEKLPPGWSQIEPLRRGDRVVFHEEACAVRWTDTLTLEIRERPGSILMSTVAAARRRLDGVA